MFTAEQFLEARSSRLTFNITILIILLILSILLIGKIWLRVGIIVIIIWMFFINDIHSIDVFKISDSELTVKRNNHPLCIAQGLISKTVTAVSLSFSGVLQTTHWIAGDPTYEITKRVCLGHLMEFCPEMKFKIIGSPTYPRKFFIVNQHGPTLMDLFNFLTFVPKGYRLRVVHDLAGGGVVKEMIEKVMLHPLYGAVIIDRKNKDNMKKTIHNLVTEIEEPEPIVVAIWPSGKAWGTNLLNGIEKFHEGMFLLPLFTKIPLCIVHSRTNKKESRCLLVRGEMIHPPTIQTNDPYPEFVKKSKEYPLKTVLDNFRLSIEDRYRELDNYILNEVNNNI